METILFKATIAVGNYHFDSLQQSILLSIASQCALAGGSAVYKARIMYSLVSDDFFSDEEICPPLGYNLRQGNILNQNSLGFQIVPNPAQDYIKISVPKEGEYELELWDYLGRKISSNTFSAQNGTIKYNLSGISSGIYRCIILQLGNIQYQQTITIIK